MNFAIGVIVFIVGVLVSIGLHEVGHLAPAKRFGVKVPEYFVGFGPTLWQTRRGETVYGLKAIPLNTPSGYIIKQKTLINYCHIITKDFYSQLAVYILHFLNKDD